MQLDVMHELSVFAVFSKAISHACAHEKHNYSS